jgi:transposase
MLADGTGRPLDFTVTAGQVHECSQAEALLSGREAKWVLGDKGYDSDRILRFIQAMPATPVIPPKVNRSHPGPFDRERYKLRHWIENLFNKLKQYRSLATRYDKTARNYAAMVALGCILIWLRT